MKLVVIALMLGATVACTGNEPIVTGAPVINDTPPAARAPSRPASDIPPATAPDSATAMLRAKDALGFAGFGAAAWGAGEQAVHEAWGAGLEAMPSDMPEGCRYLLPRSRSADGADVAFMLEGERLVRVDVQSPYVDAPGGGRVGMSTGRILELHGEALDMQDHEYVDSHGNLRLPDPAGGGAVLVFETDNADHVIAWRIGLPPQVDYPEGCS
ncbi:MAG: hypothetical protein M3Q42_08180 [Pseudomonadota bacterium]|nr:hypothetical protein [Pseudomonadota bacterium]